MAQKKRRTKQEIEFANTIEELFKEVGRLNKKAQARTRKLLVDARRATIRNLRDAVVLTEWKQFHLTQLQQATERAMNVYALQYGRDLLKFEKEAWELGKDFIDEPLQVMNVTNLAPELNITALEFAQRGTADLIAKGLLPDLIKTVNTEIQLGILGQKTPFAIMKEIQTKLKGKNTFFKAERITRTELARVQNLASEKRVEQVAESVPGLKKQWLWSGKSRVTHAAAHGQTVKVDKKFTVGGEKLKHPLDPAGSAQNTINCGCSMIPFMEGWPDIQELNPDLFKRSQDISKTA